MKKKINKLAIFDLDGTLIKTPLPETGKEIYESKTGKPFPHKGWWSKRESLDIDIFEMPLVETVKEAYDVLILEDTTLNVMMTGRIKQLSNEVESLLKTHDLEFDEYHYNTGGATDECKLKTIDEILERFSDITEIVMFEDRISHIEIFHTYLQKKVEIGRIKKYSITTVISDNHN